MSHIFTDPDLAELDRIWPLGRQLVVTDGGLIVVVGAYKGRYVHYLNNLFPSAYIRGYEPQPDAYAEAQRRVGGKANVELYATAIGTTNRLVTMGESGTDSASTYLTSGLHRSITMNDAVERLQGYRREIDLLLLNCEGEEWVLVPWLLDHMMHHRIRSMAIQFHTKYVSYERAERVLEYLDEYYVRKYWDYPAWTYFERLSYICL